MSQNVGEVYAVLGLDKTGFTSSLNGAKSDFDSFGSTMTSKAASIGAAIGKGLIITGAAFAGIATAGTKTYMDVESAAADAASKMDLGAIAQSSGKTTAQAFDDVKEHVIDLSRELGTLSTNSFDPTQIAGAMANLAAGGMDVANASAKDLSSVLALATATNYDLDRSAALSLATMNMYGKSISDLGNISDIYTLAAGKTAAGMEDFEVSMSYVGPAAKNANVSLEESVAMIGKLRDIGIPASTVGTSLRDGMQTLVAPTGAAAKALEAMGLSTSDVSLKNQKFIDVLVKMKTQADKTGDGAAAFIKIFGVTGDTLYNLAGVAPDLDVLTNSLENSTGAAEEMAGFMNNTLKGAFNTAVGGAVDLGIQIGEYLEPTLTSMFKWFSEVGAPAISEFIDAIATGDWDSAFEMITDALDTVFDKIIDVSEDVWDKFSEPAIKAFKIIVGGAGIGLVLIGLKNFGPAIVKVTTEFIRLGVQGALALGKIAVSGVISGMISLIGYASKTAATFVTMGIAAAGSFLSAKISAVSSFATMTASAITAKLAFLSTWAAAVGPIAGAVAGIALVAAGLGALGFALNPGKFTAFGKVVTDTFNGLKSVVSDCWNAINEGDFSAVATRLKEAFTDSVAYVKEIDWKALGSDIIGMVGDGAKAVIDGVLKIGDWIYTTANNWVKSGGPKELGNSIATFIIEGVKAIFSGSGSSIWDTIKGIFGTIKDWLSLGWQIAKGIATGIIEKISEAVAPAANHILAKMVEAAYGIEKAFAITWNTILVGAATLVSGILDAFSGIGATLSEYFSPVLDTLNSISTKAGQIAGVTPLGYVSEAGSHITAEQYNKLTAETQKKYYPKYASSDTSISSIVNAPTSSAPKVVSTDTGFGSSYSPNYKTDTEINTAYGSGISPYTGKAIDYSNINLAYAGYLTGGKGFLSDELQSGSDNTVKMITINGDSVTWGGANQEVDKKLFDSISKYTLDYFTDEAIHAKSQAFANSLIPITESTKTAAEESLDSKRTEITEEKALLENDVKPTIKSMMDGIISASDYQKTTSTNAAAISSDRILIGSQTAATAIKLGGQVSANFTSQAGQAVQIGLTKSGQEIAVIGRVAQENFTKAGGDLYNKVQVTGSNFMVSGKNAGSSIEKSASASSTTFSNGVSGATNTFSSGVSTATNGLVSGLGTAAGSLAAAIGGISSSIFSSLFKSGSGGSSYSGVSSSIGSATQTFNDCMFEGFTDTCTNMNINALKYTNPNGVVSYINPMTYIDTGGISNYIGLTSSNSGSTSVKSSSGNASISSGNFDDPWMNAGKYASPSNYSTNWSAKGALFNKPAVTAIAESGREMVLPSDLTETVIALTRMGFAKTKSNNMQMSSGDMLKYINGNVVNAKSSNEKLMLNLTIEMNGRQMANELIPIMFNEANRIGLKLKH